jgi:hypothetical protein
MSEEFFGDGGSGGDPSVRGSRIFSFGKKVLDRGDELGRAVLESSDKAKSEAVRMMAREVRNYLEELKLKEDLLRMMTKHSLEVNVSFSLKPLADAMKESNEASSEADDQVADDSDHSGTSSEDLHGKTAD